MSSGQQVSESRVIKSRYKDTSRGRKEGFTGRKDTIFRKCHQLKEANAHWMSLIYQPHRKQWHMSYDKSAPKTLWPFDIEEFASKEHPVVTTVLESCPTSEIEAAKPNNTTDSRSRTETPRKEPGDARAFPPSSLSLVPLNFKHDSFRGQNTHLMVSEFSKTTFRRHDLIFSPIIPATFADMMSKENEDLGLD